MYVPRPISTLPIYLKVWLDGLLIDSGFLWHFAQDFMRNAQTAIGFLSNGSR